MKTIAEINEQIAIAQRRRNCVVAYVFFGLIIIFLLEARNCFGQMPPPSTAKTKYDYHIESKPLPAGAHYEIWYQEQAPVSFTEYDNHIIRNGAIDGTVTLPDVSIWIVCIAFDTNGLQYRGWAYFPTNLPALPFEPAPQIYLTKAKTTSVVSKPFQLPLSSVVFLSLEHSVNLSNWTVVKDYIFTNPLTTLTNAIVPAEFFRVNIRSNIIQ